MKNFRTFVLLAVCFCLTLVSCQEKEQPVEPSVKDAVLTIDITGNKTKATGVEHGDQTKDNIVNTVDIFVFNNKALSAGIGMLDVHKHYAKEELKDLSALKVETTTGSKKIVVIANAHRTWKGVMSYQNLLSQEALLRAENVSDFTMSAEQDVDVATTNIALSITLERLIARVCVTGIKTNFAGTPYEGQTLTDVKVYLTNVNANKQYLGAAFAPAITFNKGKRVAEDNNNCKMEAIYDEITDPIADAGHTTKHYLYAYENTITAENSTDNFTRLVIEATLNGVTYFYPININQEGFGYTAAIGHKGIQRNTTYSIDATITRPGSDDPETPIVKGTLGLDVQIADWETTPQISIVF